MKVRDTRCGHIFEGTLVAILQPNEAPSDADVKTFYKARPGDKHYDIVKRPQSLPRMVLQREPSTRVGIEEDDDPSFYIIPRYDFYEEVK